MNKKEFATFAMALKTYYPRENLLPNDKTMELWFMQLQDIPYRLAEVGLQKWVSLNKWSPSIAEIREMATSISCGELPDWGEAWEEVCRAIRKYGFYRATDALESLSPLTRKATERIGFVNLCISENTSADRANFRIIYESLAEREKKDAQLPKTVKLAMSQLHGIKFIETKLDEKEGDADGRN